MEVLYETSIYRCSWYDEAHTIALFEIIDKWTWQDALDGIMRLNQVHLDTPHDTYTIFYFHGKPPSFTSTANWGCCLKGPMAFRRSNT